tara:strand:- start:260 stop:598 length:339 start_codon:yes stop_codon:yes gene_type:complete
MFLRTQYYNLSNTYLNNIQKSIIREVSSRTQKIRKSFPRKASRTELRMKILEPEKNKDSISEIKKSINTKSYGDFLTERSLSRKNKNLPLKGSPSRKERLKAVKDFFETTSS